MSRPNYIAVSRKDKLMVSDYDGNLYILTTRGTHIQTIKENQPPQNIHTEGVAVDGHDNIIITNTGSGYSAKRGTCIVVLSETGDVITTIGTQGQAPGEMWGPTGITVTQSGDILVGDSYTNRVQLFTVPRS